MSSVSTYCVSGPGLLYGHKLCMHLLCAQPWAVVLRTFCMSENGPLNEHIVCAKPEVSGSELLCEH